MYFYLVKHVNTILFDYGNVLFDIDIPGATARMEALMHPDLQPAKVQSDMMELVKKFETGTIGTASFITGMRSMADVGVSDQDVVEAWNSMLIGMPRFRLAMLEALREKYDLYLLSNINSLHLDWVNDHLRTVHGITNFESQYLHDAFYSHLIGLRKPDPKAFQYVIDHTGLIPENTLFIDDTKENLHIATSMGFYTHHSPKEAEVVDFLREIEFY